MQKKQNERSIKIGDSNMTFTKKGIKIQSPKVIIKGDLIKAVNIPAKDIDSTELKTDLCKKGEFIAGWKR